MSKDFTVWTDPRAFCLLFREQDFGFLPFHRAAEWGKNYQQQNTLENETDKVIRDFYFNQSN